MSWEDYGSENKERVSETERMIRRDEVAARVAQDQATRRKRERLTFGLTALLSTAVVSGVVLNNTRSSERAVSTALRQSTSNQQAEGVAGDLFANPKIPDGSFIKCAGSDNVYRWTDGERRAYPSGAVTRSWDPEYDVNVHEVDCTNIPEGSPLSPRGELVAVVEAEQPNSIAYTRGQDPKPEERVYKAQEPAEPAEDVIDAIEDHAPLEHTVPETVEEVPQKETPVAVVDTVPHVDPVEVIADEEKPTEPETVVENHYEVVEEVVPVEEETASIKEAEPVEEYHHDVVEEAAPVEEDKPAEDVAPVEETHHAETEVEEDKPIAEVVDMGANDAEVVPTGNSTGEVVAIESAVIDVVDEATGDVVEERPAVIQVVETSEGDTVQQVVDVSTGDAVAVIEEAAPANDVSIEALPAVDDAPVLVEEEQQPTGYKDSLASYDYPENDFEVAQRIDAAPDNELMHIMYTFAKPVDAEPEVATEELKSKVVEHVSEELPTAAESVRETNAAEVPPTEEEIVPESSVDSVSEEDSVVIEVVDESTGLTEEHIVPVEDILTEPTVETVEEFPGKGDVVIESTSDVVDDEAPEIEVVTEIPTVIEVHDEVTGEVEQDPAVIVVVEETSGVLVGEVINETTDELVGEVAVESPPVKESTVEQVAEIFSPEEPAVEQEITLAEEAALELTEEPGQAVGAVTDTMIGYQPVLAGMHIMHIPAQPVDAVPEETPVAPITMQKPEDIVYPAPLTIAVPEPASEKAEEAVVEAHAAATGTEAQPEPVEVVVTHAVEEPVEVAEEHPAVIEKNLPAVDVAEENHAPVDAVEPMDVPAATEHVELTELQPDIIIVAPAETGEGKEEYVAAADEHAAEATEPAEEKSAVEVVQPSEHEPAVEIVQPTEHEPVIEVVQPAEFEPAVEVGQPTENEPIVEAEEVAGHHDVETPAEAVEVLKEEEAAASHEVVESPAESVVGEHANTEVATEAAGDEENVSVEDAAAPTNVYQGIAVGEPFGASEVDAKLIEAAIEATEEAQEEHAAAESETEPVGSRRALRA